MTDRVLEVADSPARIHVALESLQVDQPGRDPIRVPLEDLGVLVLSHPQAQVTSAALQAITMAGGAVLVCDAKHQPAGLLLPLQGHFIQAERMARQAQAPLPLKKRLWQQIIKAKVAAQAALLQQVRGKDEGLGILARQIRSGDVGNLEAQAARRYWKALFGDAGFKRDREAPDENRFLNYGYAVLRAQVARSLCASGLHPALGLQHHNRYSAFPLADDLMEPYRPFVDAVAVKLLESHDAEAEMVREIRAELLGVLHMRVSLGGESLRLSHAVLKSAQSLASALTGKARTLQFPDP